MVGGGGGGNFVPPTIKTSEKFLDFEEQYLHSFQQITFKLGKITNFKTLFPVWSIDFHSLNQSQKLKKSLEGSISRFLVNSLFRILERQADPVPPSGFLSMHLLVYFVKS